MALPSLDFLKTDTNTKIPIPTLDHLRKEYKPIETKSTKHDSKYEREYDAFCRWSAMPDEEKNPKTLQAFEKKWKVPKNYSAYFRQREDYQGKRLKYFWDWMMDKFPNVMYSVYRSAMKGNSAQAKTFAELISKHINIDKPPDIIQPMVMMGIPQEKIDRLLIPQGYQDIKDVTPVEK